MMNMKQNRIEAAYIAAENTLARYRLKAEDAYRLFRFRRAAAPIAQFQGDERRKLIAKYQPEIQQNGLLKFRDPEECAAFCAERDALEGLEAEIADVPFRVRIPEGLELTQADIEALDGIIELYAEEKEAAQADEIRIEMAPAEPAETE